MCTCKLDYFSTFKFKENVFDEEDLIKNFVTISNDPRANQISPTVLQFVPLQISFIHAQAPRNEPAPLNSQTRSTQPIEALKYYIFLNMSNIKMSFCQTPLYQIFKCVIYFI